jgi:macrolide transport system ATP-binding/permease protein
MPAFLQDVRYALRHLRKNPWATVVATLILMLGIGANTAMFSILDPLLLRKLPVENPDELAWVNSVGSLGPLEISEVSAFHTYRDRNQVFSTVFAFAPPTDFEVTHNGEVNHANGEPVSGNYFSGLGVRPFVGRLLALADENDGNPVIVLSFDYWKRVFHSDPAGVGMALSFDNVVYTVVGVSPPEFFGVEVGQSPDFYVPLSNSKGNARSDWVQILGRLKPGVPLTQAKAGLEPLFQKVATDSALPEVEKREFMARLSVISASRGFSNLRTQFSLPIWVLMAVVVLVLLIACTNVANLLLSQGIARKREICVKQALGAGRRRVAGQLLTEGALLTLFGGVGGLLLGSWGSSTLITSISTDRFPVVLNAGMTGRVLLFTSAVLGLTVLLSSLAPAISATRLNLANDLKTHTNDQTGLGGWWLGNLLVMVQVAFSVILLVGASLLLRSLVRLETFDVGFDRDHVLAVSIEQQTAGRTPEQMKVFYDQVLDRARNLPGVRSASYSGFTPISGSEMGVNVAVDGLALKPGEAANELFVGVSPGYFETLGIPLLQGRDFAGQDVQLPPRVAIINRTMARRFFGDANPVGKRFKLVEGNRPPLEIIAVVADSTYNDLRESTSDFFYLPSIGGRTFEFRTGADPKALVAPLRELISSLDGSATIISAKTLQEQIDQSLHYDRLITALCGVFSVVALTLTCVGLYGVLSFNVGRRTNEIGIRMALGANSRDILRLVVRQGMILTIAGLIPGCAGAVASASLLKSLLFGVNRFDLISLSTVSLFLLISAALACYFPAHRAASVEPMRALRMD